MIGQILIKAYNSLKMNGIDVSHWNGKIDWKIVRTQSNPVIDFTYIKCSTGASSMDEKALFNATEAKKAEIKVGYYHYASLNTDSEVEDATQEANWFIKCIKTLPISDLPLVLDLEDPKKVLTLDPFEVETWVKTFFSVLEKNGYKNYVLYSYTPYLNNNLPTNHSLGNISLWIAQYRTKLTLPKGWVKSWMWQYSDKGAVKGIIGKVDLNKQI